jgi:iron complex outermembrane receptor protein
MFRNALSIASVCYLAIATHGVAAAQEAQAGADPSLDAAIIVTANRRAQNVQDVGAVVAQFSGNELLARGATDSTDIAQLIPGVYVSGAYGGQSQQYTIRGVTQSDFLDTIENPVAFYIDDVYITSAQGQTMSFMDIERVEVLKGPQGTLFGRNATGGLVHNVIAKPKLGIVEGYGNLTYARFNEVNAQGAVNLPLGDKAALRVSGLYTRIDNFWKNAYPAGAAGSNPILSFDGPQGNTQGVGVSPRGQDLGGTETAAVRGQLLFEPTENLTIRLTGGYSKTRLSTAPYTQEATIAILDANGRVIGSERVGPNETRIAIGPGGANVPEFVALANGVFVRPAPGGNYFGYVPLDPASLTLSEDFARSDHGQVSAQVYAGHVTYDLGDVQLHSVSSYQKYGKETYLGDGSPANVLGFAAKSDTRAWSQELRLSGESDRMQWQTGLYYLDNKVDVLQGILEPKGSALANIPAFFGNFLAVETGNDLVATVAFRSRSISGFGQAEFKLSDQFTVIAGARYIYEKQTNAYRHFNARNLDDYRVEGTFVSPAFQPDFNNRRSFNLWTGKVQLEYRPVDDLLVYVGVNRGVKAGNYNAPFTFSPADTVATADMSYAPEKLLSYEGGFKLTTGPLLLNASAFYYDYKDFQAYVFNTASGVVRNVDSKIYGLDLEASLRATDELRFGANFGYSHAAIKDFAVAPGVLRTVRPPYSPRTQMTGTIDYSIRSVVGGNVALNATVSYASAIYHNIRNFESHRFAGRTLVNLSASWESETSGLSLSIFGKNVFDKRYGQIGFDNTTVFGGQNVSYGKPASYGATIGYKF